ncbi:hypothetical protein H4S07_006824, partial [Coemansia furcata]
LETAKIVLQQRNYVMLRGSLVKIGLSGDDLARCHQVTVKNFNWRAVSVKKLYVYSKGHGTVCNVGVEEGQAKVWFSQASESQSFVEGLAESNMCAGDPVAVLESPGPLLSSAQPMDVIVVEDSDEDMAEDDSPAAGVPDIPNSAIGRDMKHIAQQSSKRETNPQP